MHFSRTMQSLISVSLLCPAAVLGICLFRIGRIGHLKAANLYWHHASTECRPILNAAARIVLRKRKFDGITADLRDLLHWLPVQQRIQYKMCTLVYKCLHDAAPNYLAEMCTRVSKSVNRSHLCSGTHDDLAVLRSRTKRYGQRCFAVSGPTLWNTLPSTVRDPSLTLTQFSALLKTVLFFAELMKHCRSASVTV